MARTIANPGDRYYRLTLVEELPQRNKQRYFLCKCDCGNMTTCRLTGIRAGQAKSCGCQKTDSATKHSMAGTRLYEIWRHMKERCLNKNTQAYRRYGAKGIRFCKEWSEFIPFMEWALANGYSDDLTIERKDFRGNYEPSNCTWATTMEQARNRSTTVFVEYNGQKLCVKDWATKLGIGPSVLRRRLSKMSVEEAFTKPIPKRLPNGMGPRYAKKHGNILS